MTDELLRLTVGPCPDGRKLAIISSGGHLQIPGSGKMIVLAVEVVDGWGRRKIDSWFRQQADERPWETRQ